ncbi:MAG TPA: hypothetical protein VFO18_00195, partial [Methylomirabilota bacterium]|nr:hypothetical protein [Methylomirabilota bacterium]
MAAIKLHFAVAIGGLPRLGQPMKLGLQFLALLLAGATLFATPAEAIPMSQGDTIIVTFPAPGGNANLVADATITLTSLTGTTATFDVDIHNGTSLLLDPGARITAFGFALSPTPTANPNIPVTDTGGLSDVDAFL